MRCDERGRDERAGSAAGVREVCKELFRASNGMGCVWRAGAAVWRCLALSAAAAARTNTATRQPTPASQACSLQSHWNTREGRRQQQQDEDEQSRAAVPGLESQSASTSGPERRHLSWVGRRVL